MKFEDHRHVVGASLRISGKCTMCGKHYRRPPWADDEQKRFCPKCRDQRAQMEAEHLHEKIQAKYNNQNNEKI